jgi:hypothetical protein
VCHTLALSFTLKSILMQKKNYGNSNSSPCKNIIFKKSSKRNQNPSRYYNSVTSLKFQTQTKVSSFKHPHIKIYDLLPRGQNPLSYYPSTFSGSAQIILFSLLSKFLKIQSKRLDSNPRLFQQNVKPCISLTKSIARNQ